MNAAAPLAGPACGEAAEPVAGNLFVSAYPPFSCWREDQVGQVAQVLNAPAPSRPAPLGVYLHIPFCADRCHYCYYRSFARPSATAMNDYLEALLQEAALYARSAALRDRRAHFAYVGGGTPSLLSPRQIERLMSVLNAVFSSEDAQEITFECAPQTVTRQQLDTLREEGATRISMGVQQLNDDVLRQNGRVHLVADVHRAYEQVRRVGFPVVNLDLIAGMVGETEATFGDSLREVIALRPDSVTIYQLEIPRNTRLYRALQQGNELQVPSWSEKRARVEEAFAELERAGYTVRSAYAAVRDPRRHAFVYQDAQYHGADLLGLGLASFSYVDGVHFQNTAAMNAYAAACAARRFPWERAYALSDEERLAREFALQLKLGTLRTGDFSEKFGVDVLQRFAEPLKRCAERGWLTVDPAAIRVTRRGLVWVDRMIPAFFLPAHRGAAYW
jgi:oxygen-independent coproporphyrinogen-3 oxidase